jgi:carboxyl-terminal processing protease
MGIAFVRAVDKNPCLSVEAGKNQRCWRGSAEPAGFNRELWAFHSARFHRAILPYMSKSKLGIVLLSSTLAVFLVIGGALAKSGGSTQQEGAYKQLRVYEEVLSRVRSDYVEEPNIKEVTNGALHGLLESLDPFSSYLDPEEYAEYQKKKAPNKGETGMIVAKKFGYVAVITVLPASSAAKSGIGSGDIIEAIDGSSTREMSIEKVKNLLSGKPGTSVMLSLIRASAAEPKKVTLKRDVVPVPAVFAKQSEPGIGYLRIEAFPKGRAAEVAAKANQLANGGAKSMVLDLRNSAEGEISEAIAVADLFLDHGLVTYLQGQKYPRQNFDAAANGKKITMKVVVLVNRGTAGPAEVLAAALAENGRAEMIGEKTYGVGSIQKVIPLDDGAALLLSVAKYYTPGGKAIQDNGLTPSVLVAESREPANLAADEEEDQKPVVQPQEDTAPKEDLILKKALDILRGIKTS